MSNDLLERTPVAPAFLGFIERVVSPVDQVRDLLFFRTFRHADADGHVEHPVLVDQYLLRGIAPAAPPRELECGLPGGVGKDRDELFSPETAEEIHAPELRGEEFG